MYFKLKNFESNQCIYSNSDGRFNVWNCDDHQYQDQWWYLEVRHNVYDNYYRIKNKESEKCLYSNSDGRFYVWICDNLFDDQYWIFETKSDDINYFKIKNYQSKLRYNNIYFCLCVQLVFNIVTYLYVYKIKKQKKITIKK